MVRISLLERIASSASKVSKDITRMGRIAAIGLALGSGPAAMGGCNNNIQPADTGTDSDVSDAYDADIPDAQDADIPDDPDTDAPDTGIVAVSGSASDGPYVLGSEVTIVELDGTLGPTSNTIVQWTDALGRYTADLTNNTSYMGAISGFNFDEISGSPSAAPVDLRGFFRTGTSAASYNINDFTHLVAERVKALYNGSGLTFDEASSQARDELLAELDMIISTPGCHPYEMDIISGSSDCNDPLLAVEILVRQYAHNIAEASGDPVDAVLQTVLNNAAFDFAPLGVLPDDLKDGLREAARTVDMEAAQANLDEYFAAEASGAVRPEADNVVDMDGDGIANSYDDDMDGDGVLNVDDAAPRNGSVGNGTYIDSTSGLIWQLEPAPDQYSLADAITYCDSSDHGGHGDWRLPNIDDLRSLVRGCPDSAVGGACGITDACTVESCTEVGCYSCEFGEDDCYMPEEIIGCEGWFRSTSIVPDRAEHTWVLNFEQAHVTGSYTHLGDNTAPANVRCVRGP